jgi:hypothetical protein
MPADIRLSDDQTYIIYELSDPMTMDELVQAYDEEKRLRDRIPHTLHSITDMTKVRGIPHNWLTAKSGPGLTHPRSGLITIVGISVGLRIIVNTIFSIVGYRRVQFFATREDALAAIRAEVAKEGDSMLDVPEARSTSAATAATAANTAETSENAAVAVAEPVAETTDTETDIVDHAAEDAPTTEVSAAEETTEDDENQTPDSDKPAAP